MKLLIPPDADEAFFWSPTSAKNGAVLMSGLAALWARRHQRHEDDTSGWLREIGPCPHGQPGDRLWFRETWAPFDEPHETLNAQQAPAGMKAMYRAGGEFFVEPVRWRPSIHMPRWACRCVVELTDVRVERLLDITEAGAKAEGVAPNPEDPFEWTAARVFRWRWDVLYGEGASDSNPWVWALTYKLVPPALVRVKE